MRSEDRDQQCTQIRSQRPIRVEEVAVDQFPAQDFGGYVELAAAVNLEISPMRPRVPGKHYRDDDDKRSRGRVGPVASRRSGRRLRLTYRGALDIQTCCESFPR